VRILLLLIYPLLVLARGINLLLGRDRLYLRRRDSQTSYWIERQGRSDMASYFLESSPAERGDEGGAARPITRLLRGLARVPLRQRSRNQILHRANKHGDENIPDEVYTLW
jgi:hypothetical protein